MVSLLKVPVKCSETNDSKISVGLDIRLVLKFYMAIPGTAILLYVPVT